MKYWFPLNFIIPFAFIYNSRHFFSLSLFNAVKLVNFQEFRVIDAEKLLDKYWGHDKYEILNQITSSLARFIKLNQGIDDEENEISKKEIYNSYLNDSLKYIKLGVICLLIVFLVIFLSFIFFQNILSFYQMTVHYLIN